MKFDTIKNECWNYIGASDSDAVAIGVVDFKTHSFDSLQLSSAHGIIEEDNEPIYYDLASLSKPLTLSLGYFLNPKIVDETMLLLLNHRGGLPEWGLLPKDNWESIIRSYQIKESSTMYSDFSALRFMLEYNDRSDRSIHEVCKKIWDSEVLFWKDLNLSHRCLQYGYHAGKANVAIVHDPNARVINDFVGHAGLFATIAGVCKTLINFNQKLDFISHIISSIKKDGNQRFHLGWDTASSSETTLAGPGCSPSTFGHLGFSGTSIWIDPDKMLGYILLTNDVKHYWYKKEELNILRKKIGAIIWNS